MNSGRRNKKALVFFTLHPSVEAARKNLHGNKFKNLSLFNCFVNNTLNVISRAKESADFDLIVSSDSPSIKEKLNTSDKLNFLFLNQSGETFEERYNGTLEETFKLGYEKVVIIGNDCLQLNSGLINETFNKLDETDTVLGPAGDGGFYIAGMNFFNPNLFKNVRWYTSNVLNDIRLNLQKCNINCYYLPSFTDIDNKDDLIDFFSDEASISTPIYFLLIRIYFPEFLIFAMLIESNRKLYSGFKLKTIQKPPPTIL